MSLLLFFWNKESRLIVTMASTFSIVGNISSLHQWWKRGIQKNTSWKEIDGDPRNKYRMWRRRYWCHHSHPLTLLGVSADKRWWQRKHCGMKRRQVMSRGDWHRGINDNTLARALQDCPREDLVIHRADGVRGNPSILKEALVELTHSSIHWGLGQDLFVARITDEIILGWIWVHYSYGKLPIIRAIKDGTYYGESPLLGP
jgi:hypothetical protein